MDYEEALRCSNEIVSLLFHYCMRIESTGPLRRKEIYIDSVELIASPQIVDSTSYWNEDSDDLEKVGPNRLEAGIERLVNEGVLGRVSSNPGKTPPVVDILSPRYDLQYRQTKVIVYSVFQPSDWGVQFLLHTGDNDFVDLVIRRATQRGFTLSHGHLEKLGKTISAPEEADVFRVLDLEWVDPENRSLGHTGRTGGV